MDKKLFVLLLTVPIVSIIITWYVFTQTSIEQTQISFPSQNLQKKISDTFFNNADIINFDEMGVPKSKIIGDQIFHYPDEEDSEIINPIITLIRAKGLPVIITADHGWINKEGTRVFLKGHTIIKREKSENNRFSQLETPELTIWPNKDFAETDKDVKITTDTTVATGIGMKAYLDKEHYYLLNNVKGRHIPVKKTNNE
ncbi:MAG: LPS export ABC transporter periplasmic protein LptC [Gammaproteobacteria bacterium]|nr:LPS export ABC transporter periplasmic protein LptC [Gammaproteobacteria bacterium]